MWVKPRIRSIRRAADGFAGFRSAARCGWSSSQQPAGRGTRYGPFDAAFNYSAPADTWTHLTSWGATADDAVRQRRLVESIPIIELPMARLGSHGDHAMLGLLDEVRVYNRGLSDPEIASGRRTRR